MVVVFNPGAPTTPADVCANEFVVPTPSAINSVEARMVFCWRSHVLSTSYAVLDELQPGDDSRFRWMVLQLTRELFPSQGSFHTQRSAPLLN